MVDQFVVAEANDRRRERVVARVPWPADARLETRLLEARRVAKGQILHAAIATTDQRSIHRTIVNGVLQRIEL